jgi:hypothetical protein
MTASARLCGMDRLPIEQVSVTGYSTPEFRHPG